MQRRTRYWAGPIVLSLALGLMAGCQPETNGDESPEGGEAADHAHGHAEELGPSGGHLLHLSGETYSAEWLHDDDTDTVTVIVLDAEGKNVTPIAAEEIYIDVRLVDQDVSQYVLAGLPLEGAEESDEHSHFELVDGPLLVALKMEEGVTNTLRIELDGEAHTGQIEHHDHGAGHSHSH